jgi:glutathione S-transferase
LHRLLTIPISHFCEKARWALDRAGVEYAEERHVQGIHRIVAGRAGGGTTVPVLVTGERVLSESRWGRRDLGIDGDTVRVDGENVRRAFDAVAERRSDGRPYLCGDRFTAADLTFAALAAAVIVPPEYGVRLPQPEQLPQHIARMVSDFREHPAGAYAMELFRTERRRRPQPA